LSDKALDCNFCVEVDDENPAQTRTRILDKERYVEHDDCIGVAPFVNLAHHFSSDGWVHNCVEVGQRLLVAEDHLCKRGSIEVPAFHQDSSAESLDDFAQHLLAGLLQLPHDHIGIDNHSTMCRKLR